MNQIQLGPNSEDISLHLSLEKARQVLLGSERPLFVFGRPEDIKSDASDTAENIALKSLWRNAAFLSQETARTVTENVQPIPAQQERAMNSNLLMTLGELGIVDIPNPSSFLFDELNISRDQVVTV